MSPKQVNGMPQWFDGVGIMCRAAYNGKFDILWETNGWYERFVKISPDGKYLVRIGFSPLLGMDETTIPQLSFYDTGRLIKQYYPKDLGLAGKKGIEGYAWYIGDIIITNDKLFLELANHDSLEFLLEDGSMHKKRVR